MTKRLLYIIDERGLMGGAHIATELLIAALQKKGHQVDVMEAVRRNSFWGLVHRAYARIYSLLPLSISTRLNPYPLFLRDPFGFKFRQMECYDTVCVAGEASVLGPIAARLPRSVRKVQMIHTNYPMWARLVKRDTVADGKLFAKFDCIACVGTIGAQQFADMFPACKDKVVPFHNIIEQERKFNNTTVHLLSPPPPRTSVRLISLARINDTVAKDGPRMIRVAKWLKDAGIDFVWDNYGGSGNGLVACRQEVARLGLAEIFRIHPFDPNARAKIAEADVFVLLSHYEGLPNVIYESLLAGTPVFATSVGGISEQIQDGENGWLVEDAEDAIIAKIIEVSSDRTLISLAHENIRGYKYDNDSVVREHERFLFE